MIRVRVILRLKPEGSLWWLRLMGLVVKIHGSIWWLRLLGQFGG